jgi:hypothetical protein
MLDKKLLLEKVKKKLGVYFTFIYGEDFALARCENNQIDYIIFNEMGIPCAIRQGYVDINQFLKEDNNIQPIKLVDYIDLKTFSSLYQQAKDNMYS